MPCVTNVENSVFRSTLLAGRVGLPTARAHDIMTKLFNDVTTDTQNPPQYNKAQIGDMSEQNKKLILETYPDLKPLRFPFKDQATVFGAMLV